MLDLRQLESLRAVELEGSVARAAARLGWSQPTVNYHLKNLERLIGIPLLHRSTQGSAPTMAGHLMLERANEILTLADRAVTDVRDLAEMGRVRLRFGTFPTAARLLPTVAAKLTDVGIELDATFEEVGPLVSGVNRHELDAALVYSVPGYDLPFRSDVHLTEVLREPLQLALPETHPLASRELIGREDLLSLGGERWLLGTTPGDPVDTLVVDAFNAIGHSIDVAIRTDDYSVMLGATAAGMTVGLIPRLASGSSHPGVALRPLDDPLFARSILLAAPEPGKVLFPAVRQLTEAVRHSIDALS